MKKRKPPKNLTVEFEQALVQKQNQKYILRLYVAGTTPRSNRAVTAIKAICDQHLSGRYDLEIYDLYQQPELAKEAQVIAAPTLVKESPLPLRRMIGDITDEKRILIVLDLPGTEESGEA